MNGDVQQSASHLTAARLEKAVRKELGEGGGDGSKCFWRRTEVAPCRRSGFGAGDHGL